MKQARRKESVVNLIKVLYQIIIWVLIRFCSGSLLLMEKEINFLNRLCSRLVIKLTLFMMISFFGEGKISSECLILPFLRLTLEFTFLMNFIEFYDKSFKLFFHEILKVEFIDCEFLKVCLV